MKKNTCREQLLVISLFIGVMITGCSQKEVVMITANEIHSTADPEPASPEEDILSEEEQELLPAPAEKYYVHICGAVNKPGVYQVDAGARIYEVIELAEGFRADAEDSYVNQAEIVSDGQQIYILTKEEAAILQAEGSGNAAAGNAAGAEQEKSGPVNINTADMAKLCTIPGVGESRAKSIIEYREKHGAFQRIEDVKNVTGIKDGLFERMKDAITV